MDLADKYADIMTNLNFTVLPVYGTVQAGEPQVVMERPADYVAMPRELQKGADFAIRVKGDSMIDIGIEDGDILLVRRQDTAEHGDVVVVRVAEDQYTVKRLQCQEGEYWLEPANGDYERIPVSYETRIVGRAVRIVRDL